MAKIVREVVGVFHDAGSLEKTAEDLMSAGFDRACLSLLGNSEAVKAAFGGRLVPLKELEDDPRTPRIEYVDQETAAVGQGALISGLAYLGAAAATGGVLLSGGTLLPALLLGGAGALGGGALGATLAARLRSDVRSKIDGEVGRGGLLLWVRTQDEAENERAMEVMRRNGGGDVHAHGGDAPAPAGLTTAGAATA